MKTHLVTFLTNLVQILLKTIFNCFLITAININSLIKYSINSFKVVFKVADKVSCLLVFSIFFLLVILKYGKIFTTYMSY